eukprot:1367094-Prymnesium_polylepis.2
MVCASSAQNVRCHEPVTAWQRRVATQVEDARLELKLLSFCRRAEQSEAGLVKVAGRDVGARGSRERQRAQPGTGTDLVHDLALERLSVGVQPAGQHDRAVP